MSEIKKYLPLYIGQKVRVASIPASFETLIGVINGNAICKSEKWVEPSHYVPSSITLILTPLERMSEEDASELFYITHSRVDYPNAVIDGLGPKNNNEVWFSAETSISIIDACIYFNRLSPDQFLFILSRGYDLYNLIGQGLAEDINQK